MQGGADGITVIQAIGPFIKRQAVSIHLIAPRSLETLPQLGRHKLNEVSTSNKCLLLQDLSLLQCFNQCVTVDGSLQSHAQGTEASDGSSELFFFKKRESLCKKDFSRRVMRKVRSCFDDC